MAQLVAVIRFGVSLVEATQPPIPVDLAVRKELLARTIPAYQRRGYEIIDRTTSRRRGWADTTCQLRKSKSFSVLWAVLWSLVGGVGLIVYLIYYYAKRDVLAFIEVTEFGEVITH